MIRYQLNPFGLDIYDCTADMIYNRGEGIINWLNAHEAESWCVLDDEIFRIMSSCKSWKSQLRHVTWMD